MSNAAGSLISKMPTLRFNRKTGYVVAKPLNRNIAVFRSDRGERELCGFNFGFFHPTLHSALDIELGKMGLAHGYRYHRTEWKAPAHGDWVWVSKTTNPQFDQVIGLIEGDASENKVCIRLLHVKRKWGCDHCRPDTGFVQAIYAGVGNYTEADVADVHVIDTLKLTQLLNAQ